MSRDSLSGPELKQLTRALSEAFDSDALDRLVSFHLNQDLAVITHAGDLQDTAFELIRWTIRHGELATLVEAAFVENPKNPQLVQFRRDVWEADPATVTPPDPEIPSGRGPITPVSPSDRTRVDTWMMSRRVALPIAAGLAGLAVVVVVLDRQRNNALPPVTPVADLDLQPTVESPGPAVTQEPPPPTPTVVADTASVRFGAVPFPEFTDNLIPDSQNTAWDDLGRRDVKGVVYHRTEGSIEGADAWLRSIPGGGAIALVDFGVDETSGEILRWNDPYGQADEELGVSANRSGWANGPVQDPVGSGKAFVDQNGVSAVNQYQASIQIGGNLDDPISDDCKQAVSALSAYFADQANVRWNDYPILPGEAYGFVRWHNEFFPFRECPGPVVTAATSEIIDQTRAIMREYQVV